MEQNIIFLFTGTGNSLKVSKDITNALPNYTIHHMRSENTNVLELMQTSPATQQDK